MKSFFLTTTLIEISTGISKLTNLDEQSMKGILAVCKSMTKLPEDLLEHPYFSALTELDFSYWKMQSLPASKALTLTLECHDSLDPTSWVYLLPKS